MGTVESERQKNTLTWVFFISCTHRCGNHKLPMEKLIFDEVKKIWTEIGHHKTPGELRLEVELYKKLINVFQVGDYWYFIFNPPAMTIEYVSESITDFLGYNYRDFSLETLMSNIHPDDLPQFINFEATVTKFWSGLPPEKVMKYKSRYDYRLRKRDGSYIRILQQIVTIQSDEDGAVLRTFVVHTDISHLKKDNRMVLSFIGLDGEPSYIDVDPVRKLMPSPETLTRREKQILQLLSQNYTSKQIAVVLNISPATVSTHRKNMNRKTGATSVLELVRLALDKGWL